MNFSEWYKFGTPEEQNCFMGDAEKGWDACKSEILALLEKNKYLESISYSGKECYKIYGTVIEKIKKEI